MKHRYLAGSIVCAALAALELTQLDWLGALGWGLLVPLYLAEHAEEITDDD